jgi:hypothetical protein
MAEFVVMTDVTFPGIAAMTRESFEWRVGQAQVWLAENPRPTEAQPDPAKLDEYIRVLRDRSGVMHREMASRDEIGGWLAAKIAPLAEPKVLDELRQKAPSNVQMTLEQGLRMRRGRAYLFERIADPKEPIERRYDLARILDDAIGTYQRELGEQTDPETDLATKLARLAVTELDTKIGERLLQGVVTLSMSATRQLPGGPATDPQNAIKVLLDAFPAASALGRYPIADTLMQCSPASYRKVLPGAGPLLTLIEPDSVRRSAEPPRPRELRLLCRFRNQLAKDGPVAQLKLVLRPATGGAEIEVPVESKLAGMRGSFGYSFVFRVPVLDTVAAGRYQILYRVYEEDKPIGDGLGFEVDLPAKEPSDRG